LNKNNTTTSKSLLQTAGSTVLGKTDKEGATQHVEVRAAQETVRSLSVVAGEQDEVALRSELEFESKETE
jgi:hypothetical protein